MKDKLLLAGTECSGFLSSSSDIVLSIWTGTDYHIYIRPIVNRWSAYMIYFWARAGNVKCNIFLQNLLDFWEKYCIMSSSFSGRNPNLMFWIIFWISFIKIFKQSQTKKMLISQFQNSALNVKWWEPNTEYLNHIFINITFKRKTRRSFNDGPWHF